MSENGERNSVNHNGILQNQKSRVNNGEVGPFDHRGGVSGVYDDCQMKDEDERSKGSQGKISSNVVESISDAAIGGALVKSELTTGHHDNSKGNRNVKKMERDIGKGDKGSMKEVRDLKEIEKDQVVKPREKLRDLDPIKPLQYGSSKAGRKEREAATEKSSNGREDRSNQKREWEKDNKEDRSMTHGDGKDSNRQDKRRHSSSATRGGKSENPNLFNGHENSGSDDAFDRKLRERKPEEKEVTRRDRVANT
ncbi:uncharacterized protein [Aristolochia californica]|uniref:uncharacterized protein n=1 Tax=Aristolochia californica TaxID=171875 RepID=UPI0035D7A1EC